MIEPEVNDITLAKGDERYIFIFDDRNTVNTLRRLGFMAADPDLSFTWYDAAVVSRKIRHTLEQRNASPNTEAGRTDHNRHRHCGHGNTDRRQ